MRTCTLITGIVVMLYSATSSINAKDDSILKKTFLSSTKVKTRFILYTTKDTALSTVNFIPEGYIVYEKYYGDLNKDNVEDCVLIIKGTDIANHIQDNYGNEYDRNRRGIIILLNKNNTYELATTNYSCFSSENEDGGVYFAPELSIEIQKGNLHINYSHGRYGYWEYVFKLHHGEFELIGYNASSNRGPVVNYETSINFLNHKKIVLENVNELAEGGDEIFEKKVTKIKSKKLLQLSKIENFDGLSVNEY